MTASTWIASFCCGTEDDYLCDKLEPKGLVPNEEKSKLYPRLPGASTSRSADDIAAEVVCILCSAEKCGVVLTRQLDDTCGAEGWTQWIARKVLERLETVLKEGREKMASAMAMAYDEASDAANVLFRFAKDHPLATAGLLSIVAVGVLVVLAPMVVEALGFAELGPIEGMVPGGSEQSRLDG